MGTHYIQSYGTPAEFESATECGYVTGFAKLGSYYYHARISGNTVLVRKSADGYMTSASTVLTVSGTAGIPFANFPALTVISDVLYLVCGQSATGATDGKVYLYYSADGTNWTLDRTVTHAAPSKKDYYGFDIFLIGATVWAAAQTTTDGNTGTNNYVYFYDYGGANTYVGDGVYGGCSCGSVIDSVYYYFSKGGGLTVDRWAFDGTQNAAKETDTYLTTAGARTFNMRQTRYYVYGKAEIFAGYLFAWFYDYQKAAWAELTSANSIAGLCYSEWNVATHLVWDSKVYEILTGGFPIKVAESDYFLAGQCGWYPYIRGWHITNVTCHAMLVGTTNISIESGTSTFSRARSAMSITERSYTWGPDEFYKIYAPDGTLTFQGYCKRYRNKSLVEFESPITGDMQNTITLSPAADAGDDIITAILDRCNWLYPGTLAAGAGSFTYSLRSSVEKHIQTAEALEGFICYWTNQHAVYYNDGTTDSTKSYSYGDGKLLKVNVGSESYAIKRVFLIGNDGTTIRQKTGAWGGQTYTDFTPHLSSSQRETFADEILAKNSQEVVFLECWIKGDGVLQWGQTITLSWSPESVAEATWYILEAEWDFGSQLCKIKCTDALIYNLNGDQMKSKIEQVAVPLIAAQTQAIYDNAGGQYSDPTAAQDAATKNYVDTAIKDAIIPSAAFHPVGSFAVSPYFGAALAGANTLNGDHGGEANWYVKDGGSFKVLIIFSNSVANEVSSGKISITDGTAASWNIASAVELDVTNNATPYVKTAVLSAAYTIGDGKFVSAYWRKDSDTGAGTAYIHGMWLIRQ